MGVAQKAYFVALLSERTVPEPILLKITGLRNLYFAAFRYHSHTLSSTGRPQTHSDYHKVCIPGLEFGQPRESTHPRSLKYRALSGCSNSKDEIVPVLEGHG